MRLLLDTQILIWFAGEPERLSSDALQALQDEAHELHVSIVSAWEYSAKRAKFPGRLPLPFAALLAADYRRLDLGFESHVHAERLPPIHRDLFDRMLIAQALDLELTLVTADETVRRYPVPTFW